MSENVNHITLQEFGYNKSPGSISLLKPGASNLFQKRIVNDTGKTIYFINVYEFDFNLYLSIGAYPEDQPVLRYQAEVKFYRGAQQFDVELHSLEDMSIAEMENFFKEVFEKMGCDIDPHNN